MPTPPHNHEHDNECSDSCPVYLIRKARTIIQQDKEQAKQDEALKPFKIRHVYWPDTTVRGGIGSGWR